MKTRQQFPSVVISVVVHCCVLFGLHMISRAVEKQDDSYLIETVIADETRTQEEFVQELDTQQEIAETLNIVAGGMVSTDIGGSNTLLSQQTKIEDEQIVKDPEITVKVSIQDVPGLDTLGDDLGEAEVTGEIGAVVEGYGAALDRLTQELIRLMREHKLLVVWMFDESESMKDDQIELKQRLYRVYEELKLVEKDPKAIGNARGKTTKLQDVMLTSITSFGESFHRHTKKPTANLREILPAIERIPVDKSGKENMCAAMSAVLTQYKGYATHGNRKLVVIVVSDESGDDGEHVEEVLYQAKQAHAPFYILGRESVFGSLYAHVRWRQPGTGRLYYLPIRRGPETPFAEQMQYDGFRRRRDSHMSGFGPYEQVRLVRDTGGIFFQLPGEQENLNDYDDRQFEALDLKEYTPNLVSRREYAAMRDASKFRRAVWEAIVMLNPYDERNKDLELPEVEYFTLIPNQYGPKVTRRIKQIMAIASLMGAAQQRLESVRKMRAKEPSVRWRANYDLIVAQLFAYQVRLFEYAIGLDQFATSIPRRKFKNPKTNRWSIRHGAAGLVLPNIKQEKLLKVSSKQLKEAHQQALKNLAFVKETHPRTPYSRRAEWELKRNFSVRFAEHYFAPPPKNRPRRPSRPAPPPPPKL